MFKGLVKFFISVAEFFYLGDRIIIGLFKRPFYSDETFKQMYVIGIGSLPIVLLTSVFTGMIFALQTGHELAVFGAKMYIGTLVSMSIIRELGPVLSALVITGRVGAGIAAELGSMKVTEQIDALRAMGTDPVKKLVITRFLAGLVVIPCLTILGDGIGILGGLFVATAAFGITPVFYWKTALQPLTTNDLIMGLTKPIIFAIMIIWIACYTGLNTTGGTEGVGKSTTKAVVISSVTILVGDYFITQILIWILAM